MIREGTGRGRDAAYLWVTEKKRGEKCREQAGGKTVANRVQSSSSDTRREAGKKGDIPRKLGGVRRP